MNAQCPSTDTLFNKPVRLGFPIIGKGKDGRRISQHFGTASNVLLLEKRSGDTAVIENGSEKCGGGGCGPVDVFISFGVDAVICRNLGGGALARLTDAAIAVYRTNADSVESAIEAFTAGQLPRFDPKDACHHHSQRDDHTPCGHVHSHS